MLLFEGPFLSVFAWLVLLEVVAVGIGAALGFLYLRSIPRAVRRWRSRARAHLWTHLAGMSIAVLVPGLASFIERLVAEVSSSEGRPESGRVWARAILPLAANAFAWIVWLRNGDLDGALRLQALATALALGPWWYRVASALGRMKRRDLATHGDLRCPACGEHALDFRLTDYDDGAYTGSGESTGQGSSSATFDVRCAACGLSEEVLTHSRFESNAASDLRRHHERQRNR